MLKLFGIVLIYLSGITLAGILAVGLFLGLLLIKKQISHMTEEKWDMYFRKLSNHDFFISKRAFFFDLSPWETNRQQTNRLKR